MSPRRRLQVWHLDESTASAVIRLPTTAYQRAIRGNYHQCGLVGHTVADCPEHSRRASGGQAALSKRAATPLSSPHGRGVLVLAGMSADNPLDLAGTTQS
ncbi:uncharacterized protein EHS24_004749 [Apiotrichum porosum]|uniref:Uncharacterized protein n=1 Tax=Apiotrichum porosum TaxID=105984 RepID=A0A427Y601_9TREE|nr:uncharacterized protein EHS24_004749 [Apiotrichum porosum]RSH86492.1 hypothetical protein EHS24_004749 [Apiotrichum porosum]